MMSLTSYRTAGIGGLAWAAILIVANLWTLSVTPAADAGVEEVMAHAVDDRVAIAGTTLGFVIGIPFVVLFMTGLFRRLRSDGQGAAGLIGLFGFAGVMAMFALTSATRLAMVAAVETEAVGPDAVWTLWKLHDVAFGFNAAFLAAAYLGFAAGAVAVGLVPRAFVILGRLGPLLLYLAAMFTLQTAEGATYALAFGGIGFLLWLCFVLAAAVGLSRTDG